MVLTSRLVRISATIAASCLVLGLVAWQTWFAAGQPLLERYVRIATGETSAQTRYEIGFSLTSSYTVGSIKLQFCANGPIRNTVCAVPVGFDVSGASIVSQTGATGFTVSPDSTPNVLILSRTPAVAAAGPVRINLENVQNPSSNSPFYGRLETFSSEDASGSGIDYGGLAMSLSNTLSVSTTVPPYLLFCVATSIPDYDCTTASGNYADFGELSAANTKSAQTQFLLATNAANGYSVYVSGPTMSSGLSAIPNVTSPDVSRPGTSQFGLNLVANTTPNIGHNVTGPGVGAVSPDYGIANRFQYLPGDQVSYAPTTTDFRRFTVSYIVNISKNQPPGIYVSTLTFTSLANF